jgi:SAM-dependent methyltransferase
MPSLADKPDQWVSDPSGQARSKRQRLLRRLIRPAWLGTLRRTTPLSEHWGYDRGTPVDRYYIECFLEAHRSDIHGHVLEIKDSTYTDRFGLNVARRDVLDIDPGNPHVTLVADLAAADSIPANTFDCFVLTQTLQFVSDLSAAIAHIHRVLRPGGVLLCTVPGVSRVERAYASTDYWRFTPAACSLLFNDVFGAEQVTICAYGNVLTAMAFLTGMAAEELSRRELATRAEYFPVTIATRAMKRGLR